MGTVLMALFVDMANSFSRGNLKNCKPKKGIRYNNIINGSKFISFYDVRICSI